MSQKPKHPWRDHLPALLILGSPALAAGMMLSVALTETHLLPRTGAGRIGVTLLVAINGLLAVAGFAAGALRVGGTVPTRVAILIASAVFAAVAYLATVHLANAFLPGFDRYGP